MLDPTSFLVRASGAPRLVRASGAPRLLRASGAAFLILILTAFAFGPATASAQEPERRGPGLLGGLAGDLDVNEDGVVSRDEFDQGADAIFTELDRNGDGALSDDELPRFRGPRRGHGPGMGRGQFAGMIVARAADGDRDGEVANDEWQAFLGSLEVEAGGAISEDSLRAALPGPPGMKGAPIEGRSAEDRPVGPPPGHLSRVLDRDEDSVLTIDDLNSVFAELDQDGDGNLQATELPRFRGHRGPPR